MADFFAARIEYRVEYSTVQHRTIQKTLGNSMACGFCGGAEHSTHHHENRRDFRFGLSQTKSNICFDFVVSSYTQQGWLFIAPNKGAIALIVRAISGQLRPDKLKSGQAPALPPSRIGTMLPHFFQELVMLGTNTTCERHGLPLL